MQFKFHTKLTKDECIERLNEAFRQKFFSLGKDIIGKVSGDNFYLRSMQSMDPGGSYTFNRSLSGSLRSVSDGTDIFVGSMTIFTTQNLLLLLVLLFGLFVAGDYYGENMVSILMSFIILGVLIFLDIRFRSNPPRQFFNFIQEALDAEKVK